jgi:hypothetical protein
VDGSTTLAISDPRSGFAFYAWTTTAAAIGIEEIGTALLALVVEKFNSTDTYGVYSITLSNVAYSSCSALAPAAAVVD